MLRFHCAGHLRPLRFVPFVILLSTSLPRQASPQHPLWRYTAAQDVKLLTLTPSGVILVGTDTLVVALDRQTGSVVWQYRPEPRLDPAFPTPDYAPVALLNGVVMDFATGAVRWRLSDLPGTGWRRYAIVAERGLVLALVATSDTGSALVAADLPTGRIVFRQDGLFAGLDAARRRFVGLGTPLFDTDTTAILPMGSAPPARVDIRTGRLLWRADSALPGNSMAGSLHLAGDLLLVGYGRKLLAIDARTGALLWRHDDNLPGVVVRVELTGRGLLVKGAEVQYSNAFLDLLDLATGASRWDQACRRRLISVGPFGVRGDTVFTTDGGKLLAVALEGCGVREVSRTRFEMSETPTDLELRREGILLSSSQNLTLVGDTGIVYHRYYSAPQVTGFFEGISIGLTTHRVYTGQYHATVSAPEFTYIFTNARDASGRGGFSLVRVRNADGIETGRVRVESRRPQYVMDPESDIVYLREDDPRVVVARRF